MAYTRKKKMRDIGAAYTLEKLLKKDKIRVGGILDAISETLGKDVQSKDPQIHDVGSSTEWDIVYDFLNQVLLKLGSNNPYPAPLTW